MNTVIYKGSKKPGSYLYIIQKDDFSQVPEVLLTMMGKLEFVMNLTLNPEKQLAQVDVKQVIKALNDDGFYLQMPDESEKLILAGKMPPSNPIPKL